jgi:DNA-binding Lrp family transcriptional regulator
VKELEQSGAIEGYRAVISPESVGLTFEALVFVTMVRTDQETIAAFERGVAANPHIVIAQRLFGEPDFMLRVVARDLAAYQDLYDTQLGTLPGVQRLTSTMVMKRIGSDGTIPIH